MPKRTVTDLQQTGEGSSKVHAPGDGFRPDAPLKSSVADEGMGEFEDPWEDEEESEEEIIDASNEDDPNGKV